MFRLAPIVLCLLMAVSACRPAVPVVSTPETALVRIAWADVGVPTPFRISTAGPGGPVLLSLIYDTLTWKDEQGIIPWLATAWDVSPDGLEVTFTLAHDVRWQDGQPLTADDVAFSFGYYTAHPYRWMSTDVVDDASAVAQDRVRIRLKRPYPPVLEEIAGVVPGTPRRGSANVPDPLRYARPDTTRGTGP